MLIENGDPRVFTDVSCIIGRRVSDGLGLRKGEDGGRKVVGQLLGLSYAMEDDIANLAVAGTLAEDEGSEEEGSGNGHDSFLSPVAMNDLESGCVRARNLPNGGLRFELLEEAATKDGGGAGKQASAETGDKEDYKKPILVRVTMVGHSGSRERSESEA